MTFNQLSKSISNILSSETCSQIHGDQCKIISNWILDSYNSKKISTYFGNGGSSADAQHWVGELMCTYSSRERPPLLSIALTTNPSILTAWSNDYDYSEIFSRQIDAIGVLNGLAVGLSTSGTSANVIKGLLQAKKYGAKTVLISGSKVDQNKSVDLHVRFDSQDTPVVQTLTQVMYHGVCALLDHSEIPINAQ